LAIIQGEGEPLVRENPIRGAGGKHPTPGVPSGGYLIDGELYLDLSQVLSVRPLDESDMRYHNGNLFLAGEGLLIGVEFRSRFLILHIIGGRLSTLLLALTLLLLLPLLVQFLLPLLESIIALGHWDAPRW
jgi:hypothetical protein